MVGNVTTAPTPLARPSVRVPRWGLALVAIGIGAFVWWSSRPTLEAALAERHFAVNEAVQLDDETWVAVRSAHPRGAHAVYVDDDFTRGWSAGYGGIIDDVDDGAVIGMMGWGGDDTLGWSTLLYGIGPPGTTEIAVVGHRAVGYVTDAATGAFFVASREELNPPDIRYFLLDTDGDILFEGLGLSAADRQ